MNPQYKLTYFDARGGAEFIRFLFKFGGIDFEDVRLAPEKWSQLKPNTPFGQIPILEVDGKTINQSKAIGRFVAKKVKLTGKNDWEDLEIDAVVDTIHDFVQKISDWHRTSDAGKKEEMKKAILEDFVPYYLSRLDKFAQGNKGYLAIGRLTWADLYFTSYFETLDRMFGSSLLANYPNLRKVMDNVSSSPAIKEWIAKRPKTDH